MNSQRTTLIVMLVLVAIAVGWYRSSVFGSPTAAPRPNIVVVTGGSSPFWQLIGNGAKVAAAEKGVDLTLLMPESDENLDRQIQLLSSIDRNSVAGVALSPIDAEKQSRLIDRLSKKMLVVTIDADAPQSSRNMYIGTSNLAAGRTCADLVQEVIPEGGKVAVLIANQTKQNVIERKEGFAEAMSHVKELGYEVVDYLVDEGDTQRCAESIREVLGRHPDLNCLVGMNAYHGPVMLQVLKETDNLGKIKLVAFDEVEETLDGIEAGDVYATVTQDPYQYGYQSVHMLAELYRATEAQRPLPGSRSTFTINTRVIRQGDVADFRSDLQSRLKTVSK